MTTGQSYKGFDHNSDSFGDIDTFQCEWKLVFCMTDVMIELDRFVKQKFMLTNQNIGKGYYFWFYKCSSRSMLQRNFRDSYI